MIWHLLWLFLASPSAPWPLPVRCVGLGTDCPPTKYSKRHRFSGLSRHIASCAVSRRSCSLRDGSRAELSHTHTHVCRRKARPGRGEQHQQAARRDTSRPRCATVAERTHTEIPTRKKHASHGHCVFVHVGWYCLALSGRTRLLPCYSTLRASCISTQYSNPYSNPCPSGMRELHALRISVSCSFSCVPIGAVSELEAEPLQLRGTSRHSRIDPAGHVVTGAHAMLRLIGKRFPLWSAAENSRLVVTRSKLW